MLYPLMLLGLLGLAAPVIIHLIHRQRLQPRMLATLRFLDPGDVSNAFAPVPRDLLQLILRLLLLALFILAMVRLTFESATPASRTLIVILDQSMSMQRKLAGGQTLFERQKAQIEELVNGMTPGDKFSLMLAGDTIAVETGFVPDKQALRQALASFTVTDGGGRALVPAIQRALQQLQSLREVNTCVLVFSDHQRVNGESFSGDGSLAPLLAGGRVKLFLIAEPLERKPNVAVENASFSPARVFLGASGKATATVRNFSDEEQSVDVRFGEGETTGESRPLVLQPREAARMDLVHSFEAPVDTACKVVIPDDVLPADNQFYMPMRMSDRRQILLVSPPSTEEAEDVRAGYTGQNLLAYAVNPGESLGLGGGTQIAVRKITPNLIERMSLPIYSTVVLYGLTELTEKSVKDLKTYVENGGGLWIIPDSDVSPSRFNEAFAPLLAGIQLGGLKQPGDPVFIERNEASVSDPILAPLLRGEWGELDDIIFSTYFSLQSRGSAACVLKAASSDWLALVAHLGRGTLFFQTFSCSARDTSLPRSTAFVPLVQEIAARLSGAREEIEPDVMRVNEIARMRLPELRSLAGGDVTLNGPDTNAFPLLAGKQPFVKVAGIRRAGNYRVSHPAKQGLRPRWLAVNPVEGESDLAAFADADLDRLFGKAAAVKSGFSELMSRFGSRREILPIVMVFVFLFLALEAIMAAWQSARTGGQRD